MLHRSKPLSTYTHRADAFTGNKFCQKRSVCNVLGTFHIGKGIHAQAVKTESKNLAMLGLLHLENLQRVYICWAPLKLSKSMSVFIHGHPKKKKKNLSGIITKISQLIINVVAFLSNIIEKHINVLTSVVN